MDLKTRRVFVAWSNGDLTEGRGSEYPLYVCETYSTAKRLGAKKYIQGTDCPIKEAVAIYHEGEWLIPGMISTATALDLKEEEKEKEVKRIHEKLLASGLNEDEINAYVSGRQNP